MSSSDVEDPRGETYTDPVQKPFRLKLVVLLSVFLQQQNSYYKYLNPAYLSNILFHIISWIKRTKGNNKRNF